MSDEEDIYAAKHTEDYGNTFWTDRNRFYEEQQSMWRGQALIDQQNNSSSSSPSGSSAGGGECFVATACFQDADHPTVEELRQYRDTVLVKSRVGRAFIACYNEVGPRLARVVNKHPNTRPSLQRILSAIAKRLRVKPAQKMGS